MGMSIAMLVVAGVLAAAARFSVRPAKTYRAWWVALVATELGHLWSPGALALAVFAARRAMSGADLVAWLAAALALVAALGFARPVWSAWRRSRSLAQELATVFGPVVNAGEALWSWRRLARWPLAAEKGPVETHDFGGLALDFYPSRLAGSGRAAPCVVMVHGGGWDSGDRRQLAGLHHWLAARGVAVVAPDYRLAPGHPWPAQRDDVRAALAWLRVHAGRLGVDPERVTLIGRSAGGQIAIALAYGERLPGVRAVVALYACHDLEFVWSIRSTTDSLNSDRLMRQFLGGGPDGREELYRSGSGEKLVHADVPPTLLIHGALDELVWCRHSERLSAALHRVGARGLFLRLPWATHACEANLHGPSGQLVTGAILRVALS